MVLTVQASANVGLVCKEAKREGEDLVFYSMWAGCSKIWVKQIWDFYGIFGSTSCNFQLR